MTSTSVIITYLGSDPRKQMWRNGESDRAGGNSIKGDKTFVTNPKGELPMRETESHRVHPSPNLHEIHLEICSQKMGSLVNLSTDCRLLLIDRCLWPGTYSNSFLLLSKSLWCQRKLFRQWGEIRCWRREVDCVGNCHCTCWWIQVSQEDMGQGRNSICYMVEDGIISGIEFQGS